MAKLFRVILPVSDIEAATKFYSELLADPGRRVSPGRHYFNCGGVILACFDPKADGDDFDPTPN
ncbi:MAG: VOC family protein, partial [Tepidisphaeraceae bacterium]